jgi:hypothetical protein
MKIPICFVALAISTITASGSPQCAKPDINPVWDVSTQQFRCVTPNGSQGPSTDETVSPRGNKESCSKTRENLLKVCPNGPENKKCKEKAKTVFNACYKDSKAQTESRSPSSTTPTTKADPAICMQAFNQQQQACNSRKLPPPVPGQPSTPDTCLRDAMAAQNRCLANSR